LKRRGDGIDFCVEIAMEEGSSILVR
jgi:hypothetical protein